MGYRFPEEFIIFDLEYTAWEGSLARNWTGPNEHREIIQIGALRVSGSDLLERDHFLEYVRPTKNLLLSEFIIKLTHITQNDIDTKGISYREALEKFGQFTANSSAFCWGRDVEVFEENSILSKVPIRLAVKQFKNLRPLLAADFLKKGIDIERHTSGTLIEAFDKHPNRRAHNALNDTRNLLDAIRELRKP